jgi:hypothetical protein
MSDREWQDLRELMQTFVDGQDQTLGLANEVEGLVLEFWPDTNLYAELVDHLALYRPGGGENLVDEDELSRRFQRVLREIPTESAVVEIDEDGVERRDA